MKASADFHREKRSSPFVIAEFGEHSKGDVKPIETKLASNIYNAWA